MTNHTDNAGPADVITCRSCGRSLDRDDAICAAGPGITTWFCRDANACVRFTTHGEEGGRG